MEFRAKKLDSPLGIGDILRKKREELRLDLKDIAEKTKIQKKYLEHLEEGKHHLLPAAVYSRSFLKKF